MRLREVVFLEFNEKLHELQMHIRCGVIEWCRADNILGIHVRLEFDHEKLHDLELSIRCGVMEWCPADIILGIHFGVEFTAEKAHDVDIPALCSRTQRGSAFPISSV